MGILASGARYNILNGVCKGYQIYEGSLVQQSGRVVKKWCCVATLCYIGKKKQCTVELCLVLWCEEEVVHCGTVHCIML